MFSHLIYGRWRHYELENFIETSESAIGKFTHRWSLFDPKFRQTFHIALKVKGKIVKIIIEEGFEKINKLF